MKKLLTVVVCVLLLSSVSMANGLNLNGMGSRAIAMGGAFVALADDFSAPFWNPAGMAQFTKKSFGFYAATIIPSMDYKLDMYGMTLVDASTESKFYPVGQGSYIHPINDKLVAGLSIYVPSGLGASWNGGDFTALTGQTYKWESRIGAITIAPGLAYKVSDAFMIGATFNANYAMLDLSTHAGSVDLAPGFSFDMGQQTLELHGWGYGATIGILIKPSEKFSIGATYRSASKVKLKGTTEISNFDTFVGMLGMSASSTSDTDIEVTWPMWLGLGVAFKPIMTLTVTFDVQYTDWKKIDSIDLEFKDAIWQLLLQDGAAMPMHWKSVWQIRGGVEYWVSEALALRGGFYWDPSPSPDTTMNVLLPSFDFTGITFGIGYKAGGLILDFCLEYLSGKQRTIAPYPAADPENMPGVYNMKIIVPTVSVGFGW